jgi:hypothetical protein
LFSLSTRRQAGIAKRKNWNEFFFWSDSLVEKVTRRRKEEVDKKLLRKAWVFVFAKMYLVQEKGGAIALMIAALCFLGTWPALLNLVERQGRNLMHTYLDYSFTNYLVAIIFAFTLGQIGSSTPESPNFLTQLHQVNNFWCPRQNFQGGGRVMV